MRGVIKALSIYFSIIGLIISYGAATTTITTITPCFFTVIIINAVTIATEDIAEATIASRIHTRYQTNTN
jgi:hypothetical protein